MTQVLPSPFFKIQGLPQPSAGPGHNLLGPIAETSSMVRPRIGGSRRMKKRRQASCKITKHSHRRQKTRKQKGGFLPSIGEAFAAAAAKYAAPIALYGLFRFMNRSKKTRRHRRR